MLTAVRIDGRHGLQVHAVVESIGCNGIGSAGRCESTRNVLATGGNTGAEQLSPNKSLTSGHELKKIMTNRCSTCAFGRLFHSFLSRPTKTPIWAGLASQHSSLRLCLACGLRLPVLQHLLCPTSALQRDVGYLCTSNWQQSSLLS